MKTKNKRVKARKMALRHSRIDNYHEYSLHPDATDAHMQELADGACNRAVIVSAVHVLPADAASYDKMIGQIAEVLPANSYWAPRNAAHAIAAIGITRPKEGKK